MTLADITKALADLDAEKTDLEIRLNTANINLDKVRDKTLNLNKRLESVGTLIGAYKQIQAVLTAEA